MKELKNLELANESFWLWPSIADAVQTFLRRRERAEEYERLWRIIHIWESIATTLSNVAVSALVAQNATADLLKARECLYGVTWDKIEDVIKSKGQGALDGSNDQRIEILNVVQKSEEEYDSFLFELRAFLSVSEVSLSPDNSKTFKQELQEFSRAWRRVCDIPSNLDRASTQTVFTVYDCFKTMNVFRNRFAHVPFPFDPLRDLVNSAEDLTELLFSTPPLPSRDIDKDYDGRSSALTGCLMRGKDQWRGAVIFTNRNDQVNDLEFGFPARKVSERWKASPFIHVDVSKRSYVLTRLKDIEIGTFEYTRFWAEGDAILTADDPAGLAVIPRPCESDYRSIVAENAGENVEHSHASNSDGEATELLDEPKDVGDSKELSPLKTATTYSEAMAAIRDRSYDAAIPYLREDVRNRPQYHPAWLKLGYALREKAGRDVSDPSESLKLLDEACSAFTRAMEHIDEGYKATASYDRSKAWLRCYQLSENPDFAMNAWQDALQAAKLDSDYKYQSWIEYLERMLPAWTRGYRRQG
jgi:hypothetical protein